MKNNMRKWLSDLLASKTKKAMPILSFPSIQLMGINVRELISSSDSQAKGMKLIADKTDAAASVSLMDLSVEAECFGSEIRFTDDEIPTVVGSIINSAEDAEALQVPAVGSKRTGIYIEAIEKAKKMITDRPVFAGIIGPFSLAGRLVDVTEAMVLCYEDPDMMHTVLTKASDFLAEYAKAYKKAGADGIIMAEPLAGMLSPSLAEEFSEPYVRKINEAVQDEDFIVIYHNCGNSTIQMAPSILATGSDAYHFGNSIDMKTMLEHIPENTIVMGNVDPAGQIKNGTVESVKEETKRIMANCCGHKNFVISSGCDIPPASPWENIDAFFQAVKEFYGNN